ncbi:MAG: cytochrome c biogenesis protein CcsA [Bacteriovoracaceae bacterium]|nr:cytochrome c biogenesis protein CcsA [Bacteriovoracaceae bacterium]
MILNLFLMLTLQLSAQDKEAYFCQNEYESLPVQAQGRVKPLRVLAEETLRFISGSSKLDDKSATEAFCLLSLESMGLKNNLKLMAKVEHVKAKEFLGLEASVTMIDANTLVENKDTLRAQYMSQKENDSYKKELNKLLTRAKFIEELKAGNLWTVPVVDNQQITWQALPDFLTEERVSRFKDSGRDPFTSAFYESKDAYVQVAGDAYLLELTYVKYNLFTWSMCLALMALGFLVVRKKVGIGLFFVISLLLIEISGIMMRIFISGRAPITNMYETVMFSGFGCLVLALIIYGIKKDKLYLLAGISYNLLCLLMMKFANNMLDPSIQTLVPVLRDNFWLSTHVTTVILSYAALALSWILANIVLIKKMRSQQSVEDERYDMNLIYTCLKFGVVLLSAGVILGGVWADYSWGRFWGWDPKETWSLIVLLVYMAILHGKYSAWINNKNFVPLVAAAFMSVMMAWFGVNYILATGLHSYGFSEGGAIFLGSFFMAQTVFLIVYLLKAKPKIDKPTQA